jgi:hypothetical protein
MDNSEIPLKFIAEGDKNEIIIFDKQIWEILI